jgi:hypothetical protein
LLNIFLGLSTLPGAAAIGDPMLSRLCTEPLPLPFRGDVKIGEVSVVKGVRAETLLLFRCDGVETNEELLENASDSSYSEYDTSLSDSACIKWWGKKKIKVKTVMLETAANN